MLSGENKIFERSTGKPLLRFIMPAAIVLSTAFSQAVIAQKCEVLDYTGKPLPSETVEGRWRVKTHFVGKDNGDPCKLEILIENGADKIYNIASLSKKMTAIIAWDEVKAGRLDLNEILVISDWAYGQSKYRSHKREMSVRDLLRGMMVGSWNDAATTLAVRIITGENKRWSRKDVMMYEKKFAKEMMTVKAQALGMVRTHYTSPSGLPGDSTDHPKGPNGELRYKNPLATSTPREQAFLSSYIRKYYPEILKDSSLPVVIVPDVDILGDGTVIKSNTVQNTNRLVPGSTRRYADVYPGTVGGKTGGINASGLNQSTIISCSMESLPRSTIASFSMASEVCFLIIETSGDERDKITNTPSVVVRNEHIHDLANRALSELRKIKTWASPGYGSGQIAFPFE